MFIHPKPDKPSCHPDMSIETAFRQVMNQFLCPDCSGNFQPVHPPLCRQCGTAFYFIDDRRQLCDNCIQSPRHFDQARAVGMYEGALKQLILDFKFHGKIHLAEPFAHLMLHIFLSIYDRQSQTTAVPDIVVPVPLYAARLRKRGFNQAFLLAERFVALVERRSVSGQPLPKTDRTLLLRSRRTAPQSGLDKTHRKTNIAGAFRIDAPEKADGKHILLVDDVFTTGATVDECARVLIDAGAARVDVLTLARA